MFLQKIDIWVNQCITRQPFKLTHSLGLGGAITLSGCLLSVFWGNNALAQITSDTTLGIERSIVTPLDAQGLPVDRIDGGAIRGTNLFHSFLEFNVAANRGAYFFSPANIQNILTRVTGSNPSQILGTLGTFGASSPNLFLMNPNGIIFGQNASLDVGGSFVATTANAARLGDTGLFSASEPTSSNLLSVNPSAFFFNAASNQAVVNRSIANRTVLGAPTNGLQVPDGKSLLLLGGDVSLDGGFLFALGGRVELGGVAGTGRVGLDVDGNNLHLNFPDNVVRADVSLINGAFVDATGESGGTIQVQGRGVVLTNGSQIVNITLGASTGGTLVINASNSVEMSGIDANGFPSGLFTGTADSGVAGDISITTRRLIVSDGAGISTSTRSGGQGGNLEVFASDSVEVIGMDTNGFFPSGLFSATTNTGAAGNLRIETGRLLIRDGAQILASTFGEGRGGNLSVKASEVELIGGSDITRSGLFAQVNSPATGAGGNLLIETEQLIVREGGQVSVGTFGKGSAGNLEVIASDSVQVLGRSTNGISSGLFADTQDVGDGRDLKIITGRLIVRDGAVVVAGTGENSQGNGGNLEVFASESVQLSGSGSGLYVQADPGSSGKAGNLKINTGTLLAQDGAQVSAATFGTGDGGNLEVNAAQAVQVIGRSADGRVPSALAAQADQGSSGKAGDLTINTDTLLVQDGAQVTVSSPSGQAGNMTIKANSLRLNQGRLFAETAKSSPEGGANITLRGLDLLRMDNESLISANALEDANGGNVTIDSTFIVATPPTGSKGSDITANAVRGNGGRVNITTQGLFGIEFRPQLTPKNDITVSSEFGFIGDFQLNSPDVDPSRGLAQLPTNIVDASDQIDRRCTPAASTQERNSFTITGRGGLPPSPNDTLQSESIITNWITLDSDVETKTAPVPITPKSSTPKPLVEAQGWMLNHKGEVVLTASALTGTPPVEWFPEAECDEPSVQSQ